MSLVVFTTRLEKTREIKKNRGKIAEGAFVKESIIFVLYKGNQLAVAKSSLSTKKQVHIMLFTRSFYVDRKS